MYGNESVSSRAHRSATYGILLTNQLIYNALSVALAVSSSLLIWHLFCKRQAGERERVFTLPMWCPGVDSDFWKISEEIWRKSENRATRSRERPVGIFTRCKTSIARSSLKSSIRFCSMSGTLSSSLRSVGAPQNWPLFLAARSSLKSINSVYDSSPQSRESDSRTCSQADFSLINSPDSDS